MSRIVSDVEAGIDPQLLREVAAGSSVELTHDGVVVAKLVPPDGVAHADERVGAGGGGFSSLPRVTRPTSVQSILDELRTDR